MHMCVCVCVCVCVCRQYYTWLLCLQDDVYLQFYIPMLLADGHALQYSCENTILFIFYHYPQKRILYCSFVRDGCWYRVRRRRRIHSLQYIAYVCVCVGGCVTCVSLSLQLVSAPTAAVWLRYGRAPMTKTHHPWMQNYPRTYKYDIIICVYSKIKYCFITRLADPSRCCQWKIKFPC